MNELSIIQSLFTSTSVVFVDLSSKVKVTFLWTIPFMFEKRYRKTL